MQLGYSPVGSLSLERPSIYRRLFPTLVRTCRHDSSPAHWASVPRNKRRLLGRHVAPRSELISIAQGSAFGRAPVYLLQITCLNARVLVVCRPCFSRADSYGLVSTVLLRWSNGSCGFPSVRATSALFCLRIGEIILDSVRTGSPRMTPYGRIARRAA